MGSNKNKNKSMSSNGRRISKGVRSHNLGWPLRNSVARNDFLNKAEKRKKGPKVPLSTVHLEIGGTGRRIWIAKPLESLLRGEWGKGPKKVVIYQETLVGIKPGDAITNDHGKGENMGKLLRRRRSK